MSITSERFGDYAHRLMGFWRKFRRSKMGLAGIGIIVAFTIMALIAPLLAPWPLPISVGNAPPLAAPIWLLPLDPGGFSSVHPVTNPEFEFDASGWDYLEFTAGESYEAIANPYFTTDATGWTFTEAGSGQAITEGRFNPAEGFPTVDDGSGPGCFEILFNDTSIMAAYGTTVTRLENTFTFDADRYPPGFASEHPAAVDINYGLTVIFLCSQGEFGNSEAIFSIELLNSTGESVQVYERTYDIALTQNWNHFTRIMTTEDISTTFTTTGPVTLIMSVTLIDNRQEDMPQLLFRFDDVQVEITASYADPTDNPVMEGQFDALVGNSNGSGPGSFRFNYNNSYSDRSFLNTSAWIEQSFTWNELNYPQQVFFHFYYRIEVSGDPGDAVIRLVQEMYTEATGEITEIIKGRAIAENIDWTSAPSPVMDGFMLADTFVQRGTLHARFRVEVNDPTPADTPAFTIYIDDSWVEILGRYHGPLGAGQYGEELLSQLLWGSRIALLVGLTAAAISTFVGLIVGLISGYFGGLIDELLMRVTDFFLVIPGLPLMIVLAAILAPGWYNIVLVIALIGWTGTARLVRSQVLAERAKAYVEAARAIGGSDIYIIFRHILPNVTPLLFAQITLRVAGAILSEAGLSFLNLTHPWDVSWGRMLYDASVGGAYTQGAWWYVFFPGLFIVLTALSFTLVGYAVDEILNPRLRVRTG